MVKKVVVISTGGTGGHVFPALAMAEELKENGYNVIIIIDERGRKYLPHNNDFKIIVITAFAISGNILQKIIKLTLLVKNIIFSAWILLKNRAILVIGFGGYSSFPCCAASVLLRIPFALHEQNAILGRANAFLARYASLIATSFANTKDILEKYQYKTRFVGNLVRSKIKEVLSKKYVANKKLNILVIGGSQGASVFSDVIPEAIASLEAEYKNKINLVFQASNNDISRTKEIFLKNTIKAEVKSFFEDIEQKLLNCDLVISRSGASTIAELEYLVKPAILVPLPSAIKNHQLLNAMEFIKNNSGTILEEGKDFTPKILREKIIEFIKKPKKEESNLSRNRSINFITALKEIGLLQ